MPQQQSPASSGLALSRGGLCFESCGDVQFLGPWLLGPSPKQCVKQWPIFSENSILVQTSWVQVGVMAAQLPFKYSLAGGGGVMLRWGSGLLEFRVWGLGAYVVSGLLQDA